MTGRLASLTILAVVAAWTPAAALDEIVTPKTFTFAAPPDPFVFENGQRFGPITVVYETYGKLDPDGRNAILVLHGLGGTAHAAGRHRPDGPLGWWDGLIDRANLSTPASISSSARRRSPGATTTTSPGPGPLDRSRSIPVPESRME